MTAAAAEIGEETGEAAIGRRRVGAKADMDEATAIAAALARGGGTAARGGAAAHRAAAEVVKAAAGSEIGASETEVRTARSSHSDHSPAEGAGVPPQPAAQRGQAMPAAGVELGNAPRR